LGLGWFGLVSWMGVDEDEDEDEDEDGDVCVFSDWRGKLQREGKGRGLLTPATAALVKKSRDKIPLLRIFIFLVCLFVQGFFLLSIVFRRRRRRRRRRRELPFRSSASSRYLTKSPYPVRSSGRPAIRLIFRLILPDLRRRDENLGLILKEEE